MEWLLKVALVSLRLSPLVVGAPVFGNIPVPAAARIVLLVALATGLAGSLTVAPQSVETLPWMALHELLVGATLAAGLYTGFAALHFGGRLLDLQIGFGIASLVDFANSTNMPLIGTLLSMAGVLFFFAIDGHHVLLHVLQLSLTRIPPGGALDSIDAGAVVAQFGSAFSFGFMIVAPVVICLLLVDLGMAFMSRTMPQMNVFILSLAVKVLVGLVVLALSIPFAGAVMQRVFDAVFEGWARVVS